LIVRECDCSDQSKAAVEILRAEGGILAYICPKHRDAQLFSRFLKLATLDSSNALNIHEARDVYLGHEGEKRQLRIVAVMMQDLGLTHVFFTEQQSRTRRGAHACRHTVRNATFAWTLNSAESWSFT
jgi:GTP cyclohydrolase II